MTQTITLIDKITRKHLAEARSYGIGFVFCKKEGDTFTTVDGISPCKDYLNDQVYSEMTGKPYGAWGYKASKKDLFADGWGYVCMGVMPNWNGKEHATNAVEIPGFKKSLKAIQSFINFFEDLLKVEQRTELEEVADNRYLAKIPLFWCEKTYLISLWSLLIRIALESGYDFHEAYSPMEEIEHCKTKDSSNMANALPKLKAMIDGKRPEQDWGTSRSWHDEGIVSYIGLP